MVKTLKLPTAGEGELAQVFCWPGASRQSLPKAPKPGVAEACQCLAVVAAGCPATPEPRPGCDRGIQLARQPPIVSFLFPCRQPESLVDAIVYGGRACVGRWWPRPKDFPTRLLGAYSRGSSKVALERDAFYRAIIGHQVRRS